MVSGGIATHSLDYKRSAGGFIHGYRYTGENLCQAIPFHGFRYAGETLRQPSLVSSMVYW